MDITRRIIFVITLAALSGTSDSCIWSKGTSEPQTSASQPARTPITPPLIGETRPRDFPGIRNAVTYHEGFVSGGVPEGDVGFETLAAMGIKTIISVYGAEPEVDKAASRGIRYIHLPIGYNGFDENRKLELVRATRDAMEVGPVYIHCQHGKHRSAAAAATIAASLGWQTPESGVQRMKVSGTAPKYKGLYACAIGATVLSANLIDAVPANFASVVKPSGFVKAMLDIDEVYENMKTIAKAEWNVPADRSDLVPVAEAERLAGCFRQLSESAYTNRKPAEFTTLLRESNVRVKSLADLLATGEREAIKLDTQLELVAASCKDCHAQYRDLSPD